MVYTLIFCATVWLLPLFPAKPQVAPIYNPLDHLMPPPFPLLLIVPALVTSHNGGAVVRGNAGTVSSTNPAHLDDVVAEVSLASADQVVAAFRVAHEAQRAWAATPAPPPA